MAVTFTYKNHKIKIKSVRSNDNKRRLFTYEVFGKYSAFSIMGWKLAMKALASAKIHIDLSEQMEQGYNPIRIVSSLEVV